MQKQPFGFMVMLQVDFFEGLGLFISHKDKDNDKDKDQDKDKTKTANSPTWNQQTHNCFQ
jgi:hypothetical protein